jgi:endonuclease/exonuclease/phosphatase family metal-dependent hydrolase
MKSFSFLFLFVCATIFFACVETTTVANGFVEVVDSYSEWPAISRLSVLRRTDSWNNDLNTAKQELNVLSKEMSNQSDEQRLAIMSFNIRYDEPRDGEHNWRFRRQAAVDMILDQKVDIVGIQEGLEHQVAYLDSALHEFNTVGVGRDSQNPKGNEFSSIFYKPSRFELLDSGTQWLSETPSIPSKGWDASLNRIYTWVKLKDKKSQKKMIVINTHFDHRGAVARKESAKLIAKVAKELSEEKNIPLFVIGDFNAVPDDPLFEPIYNYLQSAQQTAPVTDNHGTFNAFKDGYEGNIIDYIFYRNARPLRYETVIKNYGVKFVSDHYPVVSVLVF